MTLRRLATFEDWRHCIEVSCGIPLTKAFVAQRIAELSDPSDEKTRRFVETWGDSHRLQVLAWFQEAQRGLNTLLGSNA